MKTGGGLGRGRKALCCARFCRPSFGRLHSFAYSVLEEYMTRLVWRRRTLTHGQCQVVSPKVLSRTGDVKSTLIGHLAVVPATPCSTCTFPRHTTCYAPSQYELLRVPYAMVRQHTFWHDAAMAAPFSLSAPYPSLLDAARPFFDEKRECRHLWTCTET
jgi:hypothetical protein